MYEKKPYNKKETAKPRIHRNNRKRINNRSNDFSYSNEKKVEHRVPEIKKDAVRILVIGGV